MTLSSISPNLSKHWRFFFFFQPVWRGKTRLTCPKVQSAVTSKPWRDSGRASFYPSHSRRQKKALSAGWVLTDCLNVNWDLRYVEFIPSEMNTRPRRSVIQIHYGCSRVEQSWESGSYSFNFWKTKEMSRIYWNKSLKCMISSQYLTTQCWEGLLNHRLSTLWYDVLIRNVSSNLCLAI